MQHFCALGEPQAQLKRLNPSVKVAWACGMMGGMGYDWAHFGSVVKAARAAKGMTQADLAAEVGVSLSTVQGIERGARTQQKILPVHKAVFRALGWDEATIAVVLQGGQPPSVSTRAAEAMVVALQPAVSIEAGVAAGGEVDDLLDDLTERVRAALLGGTVADADAIGLGDEPDDGEVVLIWKRGERPDATPEQLRADVKKWARLQRVAREILADDDPPT